MITTAVFILSCPLISYAAILGVGQAENTVIRNYKDYISMDYDGTPANKQGALVNNTAILVGEYIGNLNVKGTNNVDINLKSTGTAKFSPVSMSAGSSIRVVLYSDRESDSFRAGIIGPGGSITYASSGRGAISYTFPINTSGSYTVYVEGRNGSNGNDMHITGTIYVNY